MIQVCYYEGCGVVYGEKKPLSNKGRTHGLCPKHLKISLKEIKAEMKKISMVTDECEWGTPSHRSERCSMKDGHPEAIELRRRKA